MRKVRPERGDLFLRRRCAARRFATDYSREHLVTGLALVPVVALGGALGERVRSLLPERHLQLAVYCCLFGSGYSLL